MPTAPASTRSPSTRATTATPRCWRTGGCSGAAGTTRRAMTPCRLYSANPDGTDLELYYGVNSHLTGTQRHGGANSCTHTRCRTAAFSRSSASTPASTSAAIWPSSTASSTWRTPQPCPASNTNLKGPGQTAATTYNVVTIPGPSPGGRFNSGYPLWDNTNRILVSWSQCRLLDQTQTPPVIVPCTTRRRSPHPTRWWRRRCTACGCSILRRTRCCR